MLNVLRYSFVYFAVIFSASVQAGQILGYVDGINDDNSQGTRYRIWGWACDSGVNQSIDVHLYAGGEAGKGGQFLKSTSANRVWTNEGMTGLGNICSTTQTPHRYHFDLSAEEVRAVAGQQIFVHGISKSNSSNLAIAHSGMFQFPTPPVILPEIIGRIDSWTRMSDGRYVLSGWACDRTKASSINVHVYAGGAAGSTGARNVKMALSNLTSNNTVSAACKTSGVPHNFSIVFSQQELIANKGEKIFLHGISTSGRSNAAVERSGVFSFPNQEVNLSSLPLTPEGDVIVPKGVTATIDQPSFSVKFIHVKGTLLCPRNLGTYSINTEGILVEGNGAAFICGESPQNRFLGNLTISISRSSRDLTSIYPHGHEMGMRALIVTDGAKLSFHGNRKTSWTRLSKTATVNSNLLDLDGVVQNWRVGDQIVVGTSSTKLNEIEERQVSRVETVTESNKTFSRITLNSPLLFEHYGRVQTIQGTGLNSGKSWTLDLRAEVGNLNRNIKIKSEGLSRDEKIGAHIMVMHHGQAFVDSVELIEMGQMGILARYPFHWHRSGYVGKKVGDIWTGQYFRNSSIHKSFQRCVTIHATHYAQVENNFCYDHFGHGYFLEDGNEIGNLVKNNLGMKSKRIPCYQTDRVTPLAVLSSDAQCGDEQAGRFTSPSTFWISNPQNYVTGNVASGSEGTGFWMAFLYEELEVKKECSANYRETCPESFKLRAGRLPTPPNAFKSNIAHSASVGFTWDGAHQGPFFKPDSSGNCDPRNANLDCRRKMLSSHYMPEAPNDAFSEITDLTAFKTTTGIYFRGERVRFKNLKLADNKQSVFFAYDQHLQDSVIVGFSDSFSNRDNILSRQTYYDDQNQLIPSRTMHFLSGVMLYDGPFDFRNIHFHNFGAPQNLTSLGINATNVLASPFVSMSGAAKYTNSVQGLSFSPNLPTQNRVWIRSTNEIAPSWRAGDSQWMSSIKDKDGSLTGMLGNVVTSNHILNRNPSCTDIGANLISCRNDSQIGFLGLWTANRNDFRANIRRSDMSEPYLFTNDAFVSQKPLDPSRFKFNIVEGRGYQYELSDFKLSQSSATENNVDILELLKPETRLFFAYNTLSPGSLSPIIKIKIPVKQERPNCQRWEVWDYESNSWIAESPNLEAFNNSISTAFFAGDGNFLNLKIKAAKRSNLSPEVQNIGTDFAMHGFGVANFACSRN